MIRRPTLFLLGAGASQPYGLPLGSELRTLICEAPGNAAGRVVTQSGDFTDHDVRDLARQFQRSNVRSIDEFLGRLPHFANVGKALIAATLCARENSDKIFSNRIDDHWYHILWNKLVDDTVQAADLRQNNVRFITFNYDRSFEFFLHESTKGAYDLGDVASFSEWSRLSIKHVYGTIGEFSYGQGGIFRGRPFSPDILQHQFGPAAAGINIIPEGRDDALVFPLARQWFDWAEYVYILGFGFDRLNCERLGFKSVLETNANLRPPKSQPTIHASVFQLTAAEIARARQDLLGDAGNWTTHDEKSAMTLRHAGLPD